MKKQWITGFLALTMAASTVFTALAGNWVSEGSGWKYYKENGNPASSEWVSYNNSWYYLDGAGSMKTSWVKVDGSWYFLHDDGTMAHDTWIDDCYVNSDGKWTSSR